MIKSAIDGQPRVMLALGADMLSRCTRLIAPRRRVLINVIYNTVRRSTVYLVFISASCHGGRKDNNNNINTSLCKI